MPSALTVGNRARRRSAPKIESWVVSIIIQWVFQYQFLGLLIITVWLRLISSMYRPIRNDAVSVSAHIRFVECRDAKKLILWGVEMIQKCPSIGQIILSLEDSFRPKPRPARYLRYRWNLFFEIFWNLSKSFEIFCYLLLSFVIFCYFFVIFLLPNSYLLWP